MPMPRAGVLYVDPPWPEKGMIPCSSKGKSGAAYHHYNLLTLDELRAFTLPPLKDDCFCFMWVPHRKFEDAVELMKAWRFRYCHTGFVWVKTKKDGGVRMGMGVRLRTCHELCLLGVRGRPVQLNRNTKSVIIAPYRGHSHKPDEMYDIIERYAKGPYVELFARRFDQDGCPSAISLPRLPRLPRLSNLTNCECPNGREEVCRYALIATEGAPLRSVATEGWG